MSLPNLFVPGAAKSGTSSLHNYLNQHPQIFMSENKEPHFFSKDNNFNEVQKAKVSSLEVYAKLFEQGQSCLYRGESSTGYMVFPHVIERIKGTIATPKFIFIFRNPIDRAYSHYWWLRGRGFEPRSFRESVLADMHKMPDSENPVKGFGGYHYYFAFGQYGTYLRPFLDTFDRENIFLITTEQLRFNIKDTLNRCFEFLGLAPLDNIHFIKVNETVVYKQPGLYRFLLSFGSQTAISKFLHQKLPNTVFRQLLAFRSSFAGNLANKLNLRNSYPPINHNDRVWLRDLYREEISALRQITELNFAEWQDDFPMNVSQSAMAQR